VLIPTHPGILCALGLLATDLRYDYMRTRLQRAPDYDLFGMEATYRALEDEAVADLTREGVPTERRRLMRLADLRYAKQGFELSVDVPSGGLDAAAVEWLVAAFHRLHERLYTFADLSASVEIVNLRVRAVGLTDEIALPAVGVAPEGSKPAPTARRLYARSELRAGHVLDGPGIVDQLDATTVIFPGQTARVDRFGNLLVTLEG
jgi:N-methylhydantoinase A/oxoprolinase/acetone carboxylase beta subunit